MAKAHIIPKRKSITIREYLRNYNTYNKFLQDGASFVITNKNKEVAVLSPTAEVSQKYSLKNLLKLRVYTKEKDISKKIDSIVYGH